MEQQKRFTYYAFISYKREDEKWAIWLQKKLESYGFPVALRKENASLPAKIRPIFRDQSELSSGNLKSVIEKGLQGSKYLIVICSPRAARSPWVSKEAQYFIDHGRENFIIPFIIGGVPNAANPADECFPEGLRQLSGEREILGININEMGRDAAAIKVISRMFNLRFDTLWQRHERDKRRKRLAAIIGALLFALVSFGVGAIMITQNAQIKAERDRAKDQTEIAKKQRNKALAASAKQLIETDTYGAAIIAMQLLKEDPVNPDAEAILRETANINNITLRGHDFWTNSISFSPDSIHIASASQDETVKIWNLNDGKCEKTLKFNDAVLGAFYTFSANNLFIVTQDGMLLSYDIQKKNATVKYRTQCDLDKALISDSNKTILLISKHGRIFIINGETFKCILEIPEENDYYPDLQAGISADGNYIYYGEYNELHRINTATGERLSKSFDFNNSLYSIGVNNDGTQIIAGYSDFVNVLDENLNIIKSIPDNEPTAITYADFGGKSVIILGYKNGLIKICDNETMRTKYLLPTHMNDISGIKIHQSQRYIAYFSSLANGEIRIKDFLNIYGQTYVQPITWYHSDESISCCDMGYSGQQILININDNLFSIDKGYHFKPIEKPDLRHSSGKFIFSPSGKYLVSKDKDNRIIIWDTETYTLINSFETCHEYIEEYYFPYAWTDILLTKSEKEICLSNISVLNNVLVNRNITIPTEHYNIEKLEISNYCLDSHLNLFYTDENEKMIKCKNLRNGFFKTLKFKTESDYISHLTLSPDGRYLAFSDANLKISIYDLASEKTIVSWVAHSSLIKNLKWHPTGYYLASSGRDNHTKIWDTKSGYCLLDLPYELNDMNFSPDGAVFYGNHQYHYFSVFAFPSLQQLIQNCNNKFKNRKLTKHEKLIYHLE